MSSWPAAYREHAPGIRAFLQRRLRSQEMAEDLCQETFVRAIGAEDQIRDRSRLKSYLYRIANNLMLNHRRRPDLLTNECDLGEDLEIEVLAPATTESPEDAVRMRELRARIQEVLERIPAEQARAFRWGVLEQIPYAEIERRTGWSQSKMRINVFRARKRMIEALTDERAEEATS